MVRSARAVICRELGKAGVRGADYGGLAEARRGHGQTRRVWRVPFGPLRDQRHHPLPLPLILGHEAAGEVIEVGEDVGGSPAVGDHVVSSFIYMCGKCRFCAMGRPVLCLNQGKALSTLPTGTLRTHDAEGRALNVFCGCGVMAEYATLSIDNVVKIDPLSRSIGPRSWAAR